MLGTIIGTGINLVANGIGSWLANKRMKQAQAEQDKYFDKVQGEIDAEIGTNYLDRADARNAIRKVTDSNTEALRQLNTQAIRGGATDEAKVAMASQLNKRTADVVGDLAAIGEQRKDAIRAEKRQLQAQNAQIKYNRLADTSGIDAMLQSIGTAASNLGSAWSKTNNPTDGTTTNDTTTTTATPSAVTPSANMPTETPNPMMTKNGALSDVVDDEQVYYGKGGKIW